MFGIYRNWRRKRILATSELDAGVWAQAVSGIPILAGLDAAAMERLQALVLLFLHEKVFEGASGLDLTARMRLRIAILACLPVLELGPDRYRTVRTIIVYPGGFMVRDREEVDDFGVVHVGNDVLSGEAWERGPIVLAWEDVNVSGMGTGYNVVVHEFAHKLDHEGGAVDGIPLLPREMSITEWAETFQAAYDELCEKSDNEEETWLDQYATEHPSEFFAVVSELFFEVPAELNKHYPDLYRLLAGYYRQDPAKRLAG